MHRTVRFVGALVVLVVLVLSIFRLTVEQFGHLQSISGISSSNSVLELENNATNNSISKVHPATARLPSVHRMNATLLMLARNTDLEGAVQSVREMEDKFNKKFRYPWIFLNEEPFTEAFKRRVGNLAKATEGRNKLVQKNIIYGGSVSYVLVFIDTATCAASTRASFFATRLSNNIAIIGGSSENFYDDTRGPPSSSRFRPDVHFHCEMDFDPFEYLQTHNKTYGFTISMKEFEETIPTLWAAAKGISYPLPLLRRGIGTGNTSPPIMRWPSYRRITAKAIIYAIVCLISIVSFPTKNAHVSVGPFEKHKVWSNFEITDMDFWRGEAYMKFFEFLDSKGGFYYERWGDAPVHSIAIALFARKEQIHFFREFGYEHHPFTHCPREKVRWEKGRCSCNPSQNFDYNMYSCLRNWDRLKVQ
ncbi:hypothetical protein EW146_g5054 [Bondarzewia mesenterica]|uniref:Glycosyltransferase family 15 protein n=1 Tax=Bondarzewia mesenterica TaxID=1095465 RepID=A0A4S4LT77_9AGAM|nr:hypothetical protein EW146_g5054 [Bondarzewia mesenterica]